ncbi:MAG: hypothetical protein JRD68_03990, partial [Deltaproteobacteria bacterium]|nr:hypothetical protein [Deltaproteobacteria bacterium]
VRPSWRTPAGAGMGSGRGELDGLVEKRDMAATGAGCKRYRNPLILVELFTGSACRFDYPVLEMT